MVLSQPLYLFVVGMYQSNENEPLYRDATLDIVSKEPYNKGYDKITDKDEQNKIKEAATEL
jgi:hypothetical protein